MYYKLTMSDGRKVFVQAKTINPHEPTPELTTRGRRIEGNSGTFAKRLYIIRKQHPDCVDWEMVEAEEVLGIPPAIPVQK